jgi:uncharacterized RDD family membrane protein YckC
LNCPVCGAGAPGGQSRCPACGSALALPIEGSLAPDPLAVTPPGRARGEPLRDLPGVKKKERTWKDEVNERLKDRKRRRQTSPELPLFEADAEEPSEMPDRSTSSRRSDPALVNRASVPAPDTVPLERALDDGLRVEPAERRLRSEEVLPDLPLRPADEPAPPALPEPSPPPPRRTVELGEDSVDRERDEDWPLELQPPTPAATPVERPAWLGERLQAGAVDLGLLLALWTIVIYFASRAAHVAIPSLRPSWPYLAAYLAFLGLVYAGYFTGTTGQSLGKILFGLRVVDTAGRPPGYLRAFARALLGAVSVAALGAGFVPMAFDPARRPLHDRLFRTRVIKG